MNAHVTPPVVAVRVEIAAPHFDGVTKLGRSLPCMRCYGDAVTVDVMSRSGLEIEHVECKCCGLRYKRMNP